MGAVWLALLLAAPPGSTEAAAPGTAAFPNASPAKPKRRRRGAAPAMSLSPPEAESIDSTRPPVSSPKTHHVWLGYDPATVVTHNVTLLDWLNQMLTGDAAWANVGGP